MKLKGPIFMDTLPAEHPLLKRTTRLCEQIHQDTYDFLTKLTPLGTELEEVRLELIKTFETSTLGVDLYHLGAILLAECASVMLGGPHESPGKVLARLLNLISLSEQAQAEIEAQLEKQN